MCHAVTIQIVNVLVVPVANVNADVTGAVSATVDAVPALVYMY